MHFAPFGWERDANSDMLAGRGKDQLPWKSIVTFLYEDHCLSDADVVKAVWNCFEQNSKYDAVELLMKAYTCR